MPDPGFTLIIHEPAGNIAEVPDSSLAQHYRAGWAPLDTAPEPEPAPDPAPVKAAKSKSKPEEGSQE